MSLQDLSDEEILSIFKQKQDHTTFSELVRRHEQHIFKKCYYYLKNTDDAKDVSQEVFVRIFTKASTYRLDFPFKPWLNTIIHNRCLDHIKKDKQALHQELSRKIVDTIEEELDTENTTRPTTEILYELLEKISGEEKLILLLKYEQRWSIQAIQQSLDINENTVKSRLKRSREKLHKLLNQYSIRPSS